MKRSDIHLSICWAVSKLCASNRRRCAKIDDVILPIFSVAEDFREGTAQKR